MSILLLFFDGVGIAEPDRSRNPISRFISQPFPVLDVDYDYQDGVLQYVDSTLGVEGLPQSATGQATILTGHNAALLEGRHVTAFPTVKIRRLLTDHSLLKRIKQAGGSPVMANAYHAGYFKRRESRYSVSTWSWLAAGIDYHDLRDLRRGKAVSHDLTNEFMNRMGFNVPVRKPEESGTILADMLEQYDFIFFEYILTDMVGHDQDMEGAHLRLEQIRQMMEMLLKTIDRERHTVILVSDHGNFEDLSTNTHTLNKVPAIGWGKGKEKVREISSLVDLTPVILREFE